MKNSTQELKRLATLDAQDPNALALYEYKFSGGTKLEINKIPEIDVALLVEELSFVLKYFQVGTIHKYLAFRYGVLPSMYKSSVVITSNNIYYSIIYLCQVQKNVGTRICNYIKKENIYLGSLEFKKGITHIEEPYPEAFNIVDSRTSISKRYLAHSIDDRFSLWCESGKTTLSFDQFNEMVKEFDDAVIRDFILQPLKDYQSHTPIKTQMKDKLMFVNPEVHHILESLKPFTKLVGQSNIITNRPQDYDKPENIFTEIRGVVALKDLENSVKKLMGSTTGILPKEIDPFLIKSSIKGRVFNQDLLFIPANVLNGLIQRHCAPNFTDPKSPFAIYRSHVKGTAREELVSDTGSYPYYVWQSYFKQTELQNPGVSHLSSGELERAFSLSNISLKKEHQILLLRSSAEYSKEHFLFVKGKSPQLNKDLLLSSQLLVSLVWNKRISGFGSNKEKCFISVTKTNAKIDTVYPSTYLRVILWDKVKMLFDNILPLLLSTLPTRGIVLVAKHHDQYNNDGTFTGCESKIDYPGNEEQKYAAHALSASMFSLVNSKKLGFYLSKNKSGLVTKDYANWFRKEYKDAYPATDEGFLKGLWELSSIAQTKTQKEANNVRKEYVIKCKSLIKKRTTLLKKLGKLWENKSLDVEKRPKIKRLINIIKASIKDLQEKSMPPSALKVLKRKGNRQTAQTEAIAIIGEFVKSSILHPYLTSTMGDTNNTSTLSNRDLDIYDENKVNYNFATRFKNTNMSTHKHCVGYTVKKIRDTRKEINKERETPMTNDEDKMNIKQQLHKSFGFFGITFTNMVSTLILLDSSVEDILDIYMAVEPEVIHVLESIEKEYDKYGDPIYKNGSRKTKKVFTNIIQNPGKCKMLKMINLFKTPRILGEDYKKIALGNYEVIDKILDDIGSLFNKGITLEQLIQFNEYLISVNEKFSAQKEKDHTVDTMSKHCKIYGDNPPQDLLADLIMSKDKYLKIFAKYEKKIINRNARARKYYAKNIRSKNA